MDGHGDEFEEEDEDERQTDGQETVRDSSVGGRPELDDQLTDDEQHPP
jgi:hypothetical protein